MKFMMALIVSISAFTAVAGEVTIVDKAVSEINLIRVDRVETDFEVNKDLGRAWVEVTYSMEGRQESTKTSERVKIEGLSFNTTTSEIMLDTDGIQKVCAKVKTNLFGTFIKETGECKFTQKYYMAQEDDGFEIRKVKKLKISLSY